MTRILVIRFESRGSDFDLMKSISFCSAMILNVYNRKIEVTPK